MAAVIKVKLDTARLDQIAKDLDKNRDQVLRLLAFDVEGGAKMFAPVDTGALMNSIYTVAKDYDGYSQAAAAAREKNPKVNLVRLPDPANDYTAHIGPCVEYGIYQEFGTHKMAAHPFMAPAVEKTLNKFSNGKTWEKLV